jgi:hypothetical protein
MHKRLLPWLAVGCLLAVAVPWAVDAQTTRATWTQLGLMERLNGSLRYVGTISTSTTVATQAIAVGKVYLVQPDVASFCSPATTSAGAVLKQDGTTATLTSSLGKKLAADGEFYFVATGDDDYVACILASGTGAAKVWELQ